VSTQMRNKCARNVISIFIGFLIAIFQKIKTKVRIYTKVVVNV
jgi:hypothetical protein